SVATPSSAFRANLRSDLWFMAATCQEPACYAAMPDKRDRRSTMLPQAILFDLDDTLIQAYGGAEAAWLGITHELADDLAPLTPSEVAEAVGAFARNFWADPERHRLWRLRLSDARREIVAGTFAVLASTGRRVPPVGVARRLADRFSAYR